jgi:hypothetical protein
VFASLSSLQSQWRHGQQSLLGMVAVVVPLLLLFEPLLWFLFRASPNKEILPLIFNVLLLMSTPRIQPNARRRRKREKAQFLVSI